MTDDFSVLASGRTSSLYDFECKFCEARFQGVDTDSAYWLWRVKANCLLFSCDYLIVGSSGMNSSATFHLVCAICLAHRVSCLGGEGCSGLVICFDINGSWKVTWELVEALFVLLGGMRSTQCLEINLEVGGATEEKGRRL